MTDSSVYLINAWHFVWTKSSLRLCCHQHTRQASDSVMLKCGGFSLLTADLRSLTSDCSASGSVDREHLETDNVLGPIYKAFGDRLWPLMEELNLTLAA